MKKLNIKDIEKGIAAVNKLFPEERTPGVAKACYKTISVYCTNVINNPDDPQYRRINCANAAFQKKVMKIPGGLVIIRGFGFDEDDKAEYLVLSSYDAQHFAQGLDLINQ